MSEGFITPTPLERPVSRVAFYCVCGKSLSGFVGVVKCECGRVYSVGVMLIAER